MVLAADLAAERRQLAAEEEVQGPLMTQMTSMEKSWRAFMRRVDERLEGMAQLTSDDLPDHDYRDCFDAGMTSTETANAALKAAGWEEN